MVRAVLRPFVVTKKKLPLRWPDGSEPPLTVPSVEGGNVWAAVGVAREVASTVDVYASNKRRV